MPYFIYAFAALSIEYHHYHFDSVSFLFLHSPIYIGINRFTRNDEKLVRDTLKILQGSFFLFIYNQIFKSFPCGKYLFEVNN